MKVLLMTSAAAVALWFVPNAANANEFIDNARQTIGKLNPFKNEENTDADNNSEDDTQNSDDSEDDEDDEDEDNDDEDDD